MAGSILYFPAQLKKTPRKKKPTVPKTTATSFFNEKPKPKTTVLDWIRNGYQFPGQLAPFPVPLPPQPTPEPEPKKPGEPEKGGA